MHSPSQRLISLMAPVLERAMQLAPPDSPDLGWLLTIRARHLGMNMDDYAGATAALQQALAIARRHNDQRLELRAQGTRVLLAAYHRQDHDFEAAIAESLHLLESVDSIYDESLVRRHAMALQIAHGERQAALVQAQLALAAAEKLRDHERLVNVCLDAAWVHSYAGDWAGAFAFSDRALAVYPAFAPALSQRILLESQLGNVEQAEARAQQLLENERQHRSAYHCLCSDWLAQAWRITGNRDWLALTRNAALTTLALPRSTPIWEYGARMALGLVAVGDGDAASAAEQYGFLARGGAGAIVDSPVLGVIARAAGLTDKAAAHFACALAFHRRAGYRLPLAWTCCDYADLLLERNGPGDRDRAGALLDEGIAIARELGMNPLVERILARRAPLQA
jgi:tetratricopeptide (TPR) repeat protein